MVRKHNLLMISFLLMVNMLSAQELNYERFLLGDRIRETSGLCIINDILITHNDSGDEPNLYAFINYQSGDYSIKTEHIFGAQNVDWEDLASDEEYIYIADTGNNYGSRKNLRILKISMNFEMVDIMQINYGRQKTFERNYENEFDCEAIVSFGDNLLMFSKNKCYDMCHIYMVPKRASKSTLFPIDSISVGSLITGADYDPNTGLLALSGYDNTLHNQYLYIVQNFNLPIAKNDIFRIRLPYQNVQFEGIKILSESQVVMTSENEGKGPPFALIITVSNGIQSLNESKGNDVRRIGDIYRKAN